jgi:hypothetical protein
MERFLAQCLFPISALRSPARLVANGAVLEQGPHGPWPQHRFESPLRSLPRSERGASAPRPAVTSGAYGTHVGPGRNPWRLPADNGERARQDLRIWPGTLRDRRGHAQLPQDHFSFVIRFRSS